MLSLRPQVHLQDFNLIKVLAVIELASTEDSNQVPTELRQRQELIMRNQMAMAPQILAQGSRGYRASRHSFEPRFMEREMVPPSEMVASEARQMHMGPHMGPSMPPPCNLDMVLCPPNPWKQFARRQEFIHKQNIARMEMNAILHQKELENAHQKGTIGN
ncbi:hypothetical protein KUCAC02_019036 [Chaenocephalus aceratus]|uniref:Uncharacterized protein n=1 Tax=Chaenocephalus aceratus TaxID=36190 RepID=A0ACB9WA99_CHAAC|nr:hypothetical protein KUCAC02_019036 [Chaenocephalus aceratus]